MTATRVLAISDTHLPARARQLPESVWAAVDASDLVIHAGDWVSADAVRQLQNRARALLACWGNNDRPEIRALLPEVARATIEGTRVAVVHETGAATGREARMDRSHPDTDVLVFGHSHIPWDSVTPGGLRLLNPGSPTDRRRQPTGTYLTFTLSGGSIHDVALHPV